MLLADTRKPGIKNLTVSRYGWGRAPRPAVYIGVASSEGPAAMPQQATIAGSQYRAASTKADPAGSKPNGASTVGNSKKQTVTDLRGQYITVHERIARGARRPAQQELLLRYRTGDENSAKPRLSTFALGARSYWTRRAR